MSSRTRCRWCKKFSLELYEEKCPDCHDHMKKHSERLKKKQSKVEKNFAIHLAYEKKYNGD